jgi:nitrite reductase (cytochrome c-552)
MLMRGRYLLIAALGLVAGLAIGALLVSIAVRQQEARQTFFRIVEIPDEEPDPAVWGRNFPTQHEAYLRTMRTSELVRYSAFGRYGGSEAFSKLQQHPDYVKIFAGYPFSVEYNEERGHMWALRDVLSTQRLGDAKPGTCMTCKSSDVPRLITALGAATFYATPMTELVERHNIKHPITCADCHDARTMALRITRPAFVEAMAARGIDVARASRQQMRTYVCAQCHVEYYFKGPEKRLTYPWARGLKADDMMAYYNDIAFRDWTHAESGAPALKAQHPEFELWSEGIHARSGVTCADCHMPYTRAGGLKVSDHHVRSPLLNINNACQVCHNWPEDDLRSRVFAIQDRTYAMRSLAMDALLELIAGIKKAQAAGAPAARLEAARTAQRRAQFYLDFIEAENSMGFHAPQEAMRVLGLSLDQTRRGQVALAR